MSRPQAREAQAVNGRARAMVDAIANEVRRYEPLIDSDAALRAVTFTVKFKQGAPGVRVVLVQLEAETTQSV